MAWVKIPAEHHPLFMAALPRDPRVSTVKMFGGVAAMVNGHMFGGLFARSIIARLSPEDQRVAAALDGTTAFDPMGNGRTMKDTLLLADEVMDDPAELRGWLARALAYTATLPAKKKAPAAKAPAANPAKVAAKPARVAKPGKVAAKPGKVAAKPAKVAAKPATAVAKPARVAKPVRVAKPATAVAKPATAARPATGRKRAVGKKPTSMSRL